MQFFNAWKHGVNYLRGKVPNATIVGPSPSTIAGGFLFYLWGEKWMHDFLIFAHKNNVMPDIVSWHALLPNYFEPRHGHIHVLEAQKLRAWMAKEGVPSRPFSVNEYGPPTDITNPGTTVGFMAALERIGVDSATHACWKDDPSCGSEFTSNCWSGTLTGLLSCPSRQPRAVWWVYAAYGGMTGMKVNVARNADVADAIATLDSSVAHVLVGTYARKNRRISISMTGIPQQLQSGSEVFVTIRRIYGTTWAPLKDPEVALSQHMAVVNNSLTLSLDANHEDAFIAEILKPSLVL